MSQSGAQPLGSINTRFAQESKIVEIQLPLLFVFANKQGSEKINCQSYQGCMLVFVITTLHQEIMA